MARREETAGLGRKLVLGYIERVSSDVFEDFPKQLTKLVGKRHGVYALYKGDRLYYVGLAGDLRNRIKAHLRDRHQGKWNNFSLYLVRSVYHMKELESLVLRIADPTGNATKGRLTHAENLRAELKSKMKSAQEKQLSSLLGVGGASKKRVGKKRAKKAKADDTKAKRRPTLAPYVSRFFKIRRTHKGKEYSAWVHKDGSIKLGGKTYTSPSTAGRAVTGRATDGWLFWRYKDANGQWVKLDALRKKP